jgi:hypothetical protein
MKNPAIEDENPSPRYTMPAFFFLMFVMAAASILVGQPQSDVDSPIYVYVN